MTMNLNKIVLTKILDIMPENLKPVTLLMEVLDIGKESAYRRLRGEKPFSMEEIYKLSLVLNFSLDEILERMRPVLSSCQGVRRCGAAALDLAWTACGRFDAFYEDELKPWDMAAGALLVTEAGGTVSNLDGSPFDLRWSILAGNKAMHELIGKMIR